MPLGPMLTGYRVLDMSQFVAGPTCTRMLAEMGAEVIKVELAPYGDRSRIQGLRSRDPAYRKSSQSTYYFQHNHSKKSVGIDVRTEEGRALIRELVAISDVVVENFAPGVMARKGLAYEDLKAIKPDIVMCSISLAGQTGPLSDQPGFDSIGAAYAGVATMIGDADGPPAQPALVIGDVSSGIAAAMAVGFALVHRERTGEGQHIDASLVDTYIQMHEANIPKVSIRGDDYVPTRAGSRHPDGGPVAYLRCVDGSHISIFALDAQWTRITDAIGQPELADDPRFATPRLRKDNGVVLDRIIETWLAGLGDRDEALEILQRHRVPCAPVLTLNEAIAHPHLRERQTVRAVTDKHIGGFDVPGMPVKFSAWPEPSDPKADLLGEHNAYVLGSLLGRSEHQIADLYNNGVVVQDPLVNEVPVAKSA